MTTTSPMQDEIAQTIIAQLGLSELPEEAQQETIAVLGETILGRIVVEILTILPKTKHEEFRAMIGTASPLKIYNYLSPYIVDIPALVQRVAADEVAETKKLLAEG